VFSHLHNHRPVRATASRLPLGREPSTADDRSLEAIHEGRFGLHPNAGRDRLVPLAGHPQRNRYSDPRQAVAGGGSAGTVSLVLRVAELLRETGLLLIPRGGERRRPTRLPDRATGFRILGPGHDSAGHCGTALGRCAGGWRLTG